MSYSVFCFLFAIPPVPDLIVEMMMEVEVISCLAAMLLMGTMRAGSSSHLFHTRHNAALCFYEEWDSISLLDTAMMVDHWHWHFRGLAADITQQPNAYTNYTNTFQSD